MGRKNRFFEERNGADALSLFLIALALFLVVLFLLIPGHNYLTLIALIPVGFAVFRILSKDLERRAAENKSFVGFFRSFSGRCRRTRDRIRDRNTHVYFQCGCCERWIRVERGHGVVEVTCPGCRTVSRLDTGASKTDGDGDGSNEQT